MTYHAGSDNRACARRRQPVGAETEDTPQRRYLLTLPAYRAHQEGGWTRYPCPDEIKWHFQFAAKHKQVEGILWWGWAIPDWPNLHGCRTQPDLIEAIAKYGRMIVQNHPSG